MNTTHSDNPSTNDVASEIREATALVTKLSWFAVIGGIVAAIVIAAFVIWFAGPLSRDPATWGQFGDYVGGLLNSTFSFLALLALLATLGLQVRELKISAKELKNSADALIKQNETLRQQTFEGTFFELLKLLNEIVMSLRVQQNLRVGRECFQLYLDELEGRLINAKATDDYDAFVQTYEKFYSDYQAQLGHYFRLLYNVVKLVKGKALSDQRFYANLVRAQLSSAELKLLFYNCITRWGDEKFKPLVEEFALLKTIPEERIPSGTLFKKYATSAFGGEYPKAWRTGT
jgi:Putative phage abortive infection protein